MAAALMATIYTPERGPRPIDRTCSRCGATKGWLCWDLRARPRTKQALRPHPERCGRQRR